MEKSTGVLIESLKNNDLTLSLLNVANNSKKDIIVFYQDFGVGPMVPKCAIMQEREVFALNDVVIATSIKTARTLKNCDALKKYFYIWELEWMKDNIAFSDLAELYLNKDINLIVRSESHKEIVSNVWKEPIVIRDFDGIQEL